MTTASQAVPIELHGDTPTLRLFALLEVIASKDQYFSLQSLVDETGLPKPIPMVPVSGVIMTTGLWAQ